MRGGHYPAKLATGPPHLEAVAVVDDVDESGKKKRL